MPAIRASYTKEFRSRFDYPQFKLSAGERARIILIEPNPMMEVSHFIRGSGAVECIGEYKKVIDTGFDEHCPLCRVGTKEQDAPIRSAARRFATHILRYLTRRDGAPINPLTIETLLWRFGEDKYGQLLRKAEIYTDLRRHDLAIECTDSQYGKYQIEVLGNEPAAYLAHGTEVAKQILQQYMDERLTDLAPFMARQLSEDMMLDLVDRHMGVSPHRSVVPDTAELGDLGLLLDMDGTAGSNGNEPKHVVKMDGRTMGQIDEDNADLDMLMQPQQVSAPGVDLDALLGNDETEEEKT